jgi:hypothetical protein
MARAGRARFGYYIDKNLEVLPTHRQKSTIAAYLLLAPPHFWLDFRQIAFKL